MVFSSRCLCTSLLEAAGKDSSCVAGRTEIACMKIVSVASVGLETNKRVLWGAHVTLVIENGSSSTLGCCLGVWSALRYVLFSAALSVRMGLCRTALCALFEGSSRVRSGIISAPLEPERVYGHSRGG